MVIMIEEGAIGGIADVETERMVVLEEHAGLDREVQGLEAVGDGKFDTAPDGGLPVFERDANPCDLVGHAAMLTGALCAVQFHGLRSSHREAGQPAAIFSMPSAISPRCPTPRGLAASMTGAVARARFARPRFGAGRTWAASGDTG